MTSDFKNLLVVSDADDDLGPAAAFASLARDAGKAVQTLTVIDKAPTAGASPDITAAIHRIQTDTANAASERLNPIGEAFSPPRIGHASEEIAKAATALGDCLVVKPGDRAKEAHGPLIGGSERKIVRKCPAPVLVLREGFADGALAVAIEAPHDDDDSLSAFNALLLDHAVTLAELLRKRTILLLHVWSSGGADLMQNPTIGISPSLMRESIDAWEAERRKWLSGVALAASEKSCTRGVTFEPHLVMGPVSQALEEAVDKHGISLFCLGSANRTGLSGLFIGNTAEAILNRAACSTLVVKAPKTAAVLTRLAMDH